ncbi:occludin/ELL domain-containing protein 1 isoform X3 [Nomascus leucogenys]|uniref:occludin/ELL domain-containing protein 1 isoform X3 n=1 Tax=Nomascus leucogenys TaxID=61853 RepID=UPI00122D8CB8|nr:occludin/ELL domain-containing protein 1 isoform X3 [Nomascus leucogenys]
MHYRDGSASPSADPGSELQTLGQAARRPPPPRAGHDAPRRTRPSARKPPSCFSRRPMPTREPPETRGSRGHLQTHPPGPGPPLQGLAPRGLKTSAPRPPCQPQPGPHKAKTKKIVFEDELLSQALLGTKKPIGAIPKGHKPRPHPVPDYELKYPPVSSERERSCYAAVFQDQYGEFLELQHEKEAQVAARVWREFETKRTDPGFLDKQARCHYLKGKLRHLKTQIQKFDDQGDSEGSVSPYQGLLSPGLQMPLQFGLNSDSPSSRKAFQDFLLWVL